MESSSKCVHSMVDTKEISCLQHGTFGQDPNGMEGKSFSQVHKGTAKLNVLHQLFGSPEQPCLLHA